MFMPVLKIMLFVSVVMNSAQSTSGYGFDTPTNLPALLPTHFPGVDFDTAGYLDMLVRDPQKLLEVVGIFHPEMVIKESAENILVKSVSMPQLTETDVLSSGQGRASLSNNDVDTRALCMPKESCDTDIDSTPPSPFRQILDKAFWEMECECALHRVDHNLHTIPTDQSAFSMQIDQSASCTKVSGDATNMASGEIKSCSPELSEAVKDLVASIQQGTE
jgi:hypothetical protein